MVNIIYILRNKVNDKIYVGQTWQSLAERFDHGNGYVNCLYLNKAIKKYGKENFFYDVLTVCATQEVADYWETYFITKLDACDRQKGYNLRSGGSRGLQSVETKKRMSIAQKGRTVSDETRKKLSEVLKKNPIKMMGSDNPMFGLSTEHPMFNKYHTDTARAKMSAAKLGKPSRLILKGHELPLQALVGGAHDV